MSHRFASAAGACATLALAAAAGSGAAVAPPPPATAFVLTASDFGTHAVASQRSVTSGGLTFLVRSFSHQLVAGGRPLAAAVSLAIVAADAQTATEAYGGLEAATHTATGRRAIAKEFATGFAGGIGAKGKVKLLKTTVGLPRYEPDVVVLPVVVKTNLGVTRMSLAMTHADRVVGLFVLISVSGTTVPGAAVEAEITATRKHLTDGFAVANTSAPTVAGTPAQGQTLTLDEGAWSGGPTSYTYAWTRCTNGACTPIPGATSASYVVTSADSASTLQVAVTAANTVSSATATSAPTAPVQ
jgi:hypothetical protein